MDLSILFANLPVLSAWLDELVSGRNGVHLTARETDYDLSNFSKRSRNFSSKSHSRNKSPLNPVSNAALRQADEESDHGSQTGILKPGITKTTTIQLDHSSVDELASSIPHLAAHDDEYDGFFIPKGAIIHANQYAMYADEFVYPDAQAFKPDRWLDPEFPTFQLPLTEYPNLKRFSSFGVGRRICPGLVSAERSLFMEISMLMWACSIVKKLDSNGKVVPVLWYDYRPGTNTCQNPFKFGLEADLFTNKTNKTVVPALS
ncbi:hypothetical protein LTR37_009591 [Vermiconidia calcicola]|uniref:Uncharacterized protein n=1 Tax=Vermiconidia calcicola TaxID=1690605 RepID=A0ACC3N7Y0_9PEZI|nr:hypothetical protein LTR37_009591 [Vermiconidia calcicola]